MIDFIVALLFGHTTLLTKEPVDVPATYEVRLDKPISAVTGGATLRIAVPIDTFSSATRIDRIFGDAKTAFPVGAITAQLGAREGSLSVTFAYKGTMGQAGSRMLLFLESDEPVPTRVEFDKISLRANTQLRRVTIYWRNCQQVGG